MDCATAREAISAALDGEDPGVEAAALDSHVRTCADCATWQHEAAAVSRLVRIDRAGDSPDVTDEVLDHFVPPRKPAPVDRPRWALGFAALSQFSIVVSQLFLPQQVGGGMSVAPSSHMEHEAVAFNFAVGIVLLWVTARPRRARSQLPVLLSFAAVLMVLSLLDVLQGNVGWSRLATHLPLLLGVVCTALIGRRDGRWPWPGSHASVDVQHRADTGFRGEQAAPARTAHRRRPPAARRDVA
ncbi:MAG TPA: zf-HC2 domain-containing protein [Amycolatopsis sp.]|nr:zf-HC2 domain-containing protein [Amycolatopsis sp.]